MRIDERAGTFGRTGEHDMVAIHRFGLAIASAAALMTVVLSIAIVNFATSQAGAGPTAAPGTPGNQSTDEATGSPTGGPQTIYLRFPPATPTPKPGAGSYHAAPAKPPATATPTPSHERPDPTPTRTPRPRRSQGPVPSGGYD